jgi:hypothetical protein
MAQLAGLRLRERWDGVDAGTLHQQEPPARLDLGEARQLAGSRLPSRAAQGARQVRAGSSQRRPGRSFAVSTGTSPGDLQTITPTEPAIGMGYVDRRHHAER